MRSYWLLLVLCMAVFAADLAGTYTGEWASSGAGSGGKFRMVLARANGGSWNCNVVFTMGDQEVKTVVKSTKVDGDHLETSYEFDLQNNKLISKINGRRTGQTLEGKYQTTVVGSDVQVDEGTFKADLKP